jgi:uncharacterized protein (TIRG00374 family)
LLKSRRVWLGFLVSAIFAALFFRKTDFGAIWEALAGAQYIYLVPALFVYLVAVWLRAVRWHYLLRHLQPISVSTLFPVVVIGYMANNLLPARIGELVRAYLLGERKRISKSATLGTIVVERLCDGIVLLGFLLVVAAFTGISAELRQLAMLMAGLFSVGLVVLFSLSLWQDRSARLVSVLIRPLPGRYQQRFLSFALSFLTGLVALRRPSTFVIVFLTTGASWLLEAGMYAIVGRAFGMDLSFPIYVLVAATANLAISVPSSQGGVGPFEFFAKETLVFFGVAGAAAQAYAIALHAVLLLSMIGLGIFFLWWINLSFAALIRGAERGGALQPSAGSPDR